MAYDIYSDILSGICSDILSDILRVQARTGLALNCFPRNIAKHGGFP